MTTDYTKMTVDELLRVDMGEYDDPSWRNIECVRAELARRARDADALRAELAKSKNETRLIEDRLQRTRDTLATLTAATDKADLRRQVDDKRIRGLLGIRTAATIEDICAAIERLNVERDYSDRVSVSEMDTLRTDRDDWKDHAEQRLIALREVEQEHALDKAALTKELDEARATKDMHKERADAADAALAKSEAEVARLRGEVADAKIIVDTALIIADSKRFPEHVERCTEWARRNARLITKQPAAKPAPDDGCPVCGGRGPCEHTIAEDMATAGCQPTVNKTRRLIDGCPVCGAHGPCEHDIESEPAPDRIAEEPKQTGLHVRSVEFADHAISERAMLLATSKIMIAEAVAEVERRVAALSDSLVAQVERNEDLARELHRQSERLAALGDWATNPMHGTLRFQGFAALEQREVKP